MLHGQAFLVNRWVADGPQQRAAGGWAWYLGRLGRRRLIAAPSPELPLNIKYTPSVCVLTGDPSIPSAQWAEGFCIVLKSQSRAHVHTHQWFGSAERKTDLLVPLFYLFCRECRWRFYVIFTLRDNEMLKIQQNTLSMFTCTAYSRSGSIFRLRQYSKQSVYRHRGYRYTASGRSVMMSAARRLVLDLFQQNSLNHPRKWTLFHFWIALHSSCAGTPAMKRRTMHQTHRNKPPSWFRMTKFFVFAITVRDIVQWLYSSRGRI